MSQKLIAIFKIPKHALSRWLNSSLLGWKNPYAYHFHLLIFEGNLFLTSTFLFKNGSLNCQADEAAMTWSIWSIHLHLRSTKRSAFVHIL